MSVCFRSVAEKRNAVTFRPEAGKGTSGFGSKTIRMFPKLFIVRIPSATLDIIFKCSRHAALRLRGVGWSTIGIENTTSVLTREELSADELYEFAILARVVS